MLREPRSQGLLDFYVHHGFAQWRKELEEGAGLLASAADPNPPAPKRELAHEYETVLTWERLEHWLGVIGNAPLVALDTETDSLDALRARIVGISFAVEPGRAAYVPLAHRGPGAPEQLPLAPVLARLQPWLEDGSAPKLGQHVKYDTHVLANHGIAVRGYRHDTMLQSYVLEAHRSHSLESLAERHLHRKGISYEELCGRGATQIPFAQVDVGRATRYSGEDSEIVIDGGTPRALAPFVPGDTDYTNGAVFTDTWAGFTSGDHTCYFEAASNGDGVPRPAAGARRHRVHRCAARTE